MRPCTGLIMAGGFGSRLVQSGVRTPKPLVEVAGVTLLERNVYAFARAGVRDLAISVSDAVPEVGAHVESRISAVAAAAGLRMRVLRESEPLGNIGAAQLLGDVTEDVIVTFADNLTTLDLHDFAQRHLISGAELTLAVHHEPIQMPYGSLVLDGDTITEYVEKPISTPLIASAVCGCSRRALARLPHGQPAGLVDLFRLVRGGGGRVLAYQHSDSWVDVNDAGAVERAERVVRAGQAIFDTWAPSDAPEERVLMLCDDDGIVLARTGHGVWTLPPDPGVPTSDATRIDSIEMRDGRWTAVRYLVSVQPTEMRGAAAAVERHSWSALSATALSDVARRAIALLGHHAR